MSEKTLSEDRLSRSEVAEQLRAIADEFDDEEGEVSIPVGNKRVRLSPPADVAYEIGVREGSSILRGDRETVNIKLDWKPESD
jgi:amphi-Trp domain-containing protein